MTIIQPVKATSESVPYIYIPRFIGGTSKIAVASGSTSATYYYASGDNYGIYNAPGLLMPYQTYVNSTQSSTASSSHRIFTTSKQYSELSSVVDFDSMAQYLEQNIIVKGDITCSITLYVVPSSSGYAGNNIVTSSSPNVYNFNGPKIEISIVGGAVDSVTITDGNSNAVATIRGDTNVTSISIGDTLYMQWRISSVTIA